MTVVGSCREMFLFPGGKRPPTPLFLRKENYTHIHTCFHFFSLSVFSFGAIRNYRCTHRLSFYSKVRRAEEGPPEVVGVPHF